MSAIRHAVIMAAGRGLRMNPLTNIIPKAMAPFAESTLIANGIDQIRKHIANIHITVGYKGAMLASHVIEHDVQSVLNTQGKGNAWWIYNTLLSKLNEPVFVLTCDNILELDFDLIAREYQDFGQPACMLVPVLPVPGLEGDYIFHRNNVVQKIDRHSKSDIYCSGIQVIHIGKINEYTSDINDFNLLWRELIACNEVYCSHTYPKKWFTVDTVEALNMLNNLK